MTNFNIDFAISATISPSTVEEMVRKAVEEQSGRKVKSIEFKTREISDFADRFSHHAFDGCKVVFESGPV